MAISYDLISSVFIAKRIIDENPSLISSLPLDRHYLGSEKYDYKERVPLHTSVKPLIPIIKQTLRKHTGADAIDIKIYKVDTSSEILSGSRMAGIVAKKSETEHIILLDDRETYCTQRLALCKELVQIYVGCIVDEPLADPSAQILEATRDLIHKFYSPSSTTLIEQFGSSEAFSHSIALELLIPYTLRDKIQELLDKGEPIDNIAQMLFLTKENLEEYLNRYFPVTTAIYEALR